ncbi:MAG: 50S ribosome-binding GTPase [Eubacteriales bacterium]|jgi:uncharacterized protein (DUF697 family)/GTP-binding protein EngB required for normal cell division|nr:50S ribosome-binding GTPase [Eubacteriales bacterium]MDD4743984.1 50S ribosome-binding GTPase [Eubacteriales bacterium]
MNGAVDLFGQFFKIIDDEEKSMQTANLMVIGKTGAGKSTLINSVFRDNLADTGIGTPVTKHLQRITKSGIPLVIYDTKGIELNQAVQEEIKKEILGEIDRLIRLNEKENLVHMIWFCISSLSRRIEDFEVEWIRSFAERLPVIVVLTQAVGKEAAALEKYIKNLNLPVKNVRSVLAQDIEISDDYTLPAFGLKELVDITFDCLPEAAHTAFVNAQKVNIERKLETANKAIIPFVTAAFAEGFNPLPFADAALLVPTQLAMLARLTVIFGIPVNKSLLTGTISGILGTGGATLLGRTIVANIVKFIPGIGTGVGGTISGTTAAIITAALGFSYNQVMVIMAKKIFAGQIVAETEMIDLMKSAYAEQMKKGKDLLK